MIGTNQMPSKSPQSKKPSAEQKPVMAEAYPGETEQQTMTRVMIEPYWRHGLVAKGIVDKSVGKLPGAPQFDDFGRALRDKAELVSKGDLKLASDLLVAQAHSLDAIFTEFARRAALNMGDYLGATETYARIALKAQANCRGTLEALMKLHQPREQTVKHVHVNEGGQAVVADHFHQHPGVRKNGESIKQSDATGAAGECAALPSPDPEGNGVPIPGRKREAAVQNARRNKSGSA
jgi:hypothetical protein